MKYLLVEKLEDGHIVNETYFSGDAVDLLRALDKSDYTCEAYCQMTHIYDYIHVKERIV